VWIAGGGFCTGTLIAPSVVLTAGHCVQDQIDGFYLGAGTATTMANFGSVPAAGFTKYAVDKWLAHPSYVGGTCPNTTFDIGLVHLSQPLTTVAATPIATAGSPPASGQSCEAVGFGTHTENGVDTFEQKRSGTEIVQSVATTSVQVKAGTALADHGDSGGPLICGGAIAGATSCHTDGDWPAHQIEHYARIDGAAAWINSQITSWGSVTVPDAGPPVPDAGPGPGTDGGTCAHDKCATGVSLTASCGACEATICNADPYCCATAWDGQCVSEVSSYCGATCQ
jgi:hypothetical protein